MHRNLVIAHIYVIISVFLILQGVKMWWEAAERAEVLQEWVFKREFTQPLVITQADI